MDTLLGWGLLLIQIFWGFFLFKSLASVKDFTKEAVDNLLAGDSLQKLKTGAMIQAAWMYGGITWLLYGWGWGLAAFLIMWAVMATAVRNAATIIVSQALREQEQGAGQGGQQ